MAFEWTDEQQAIFDSHGKNILVSASAGSGKTTVMIQKIINLVLNENDRTPISKFLVVTFTKASAEDMKAKLIDAFMEHQDDEFCLNQIDEVDTSDISNLHSFCSRLISTYFYEVNVDPNYQVLDGAVSALLQDRALDKLFERKEKQGDENYLKLFEVFQKKRQNKPLKNIIKKFNNYLNANLDSERWFFDSLETAYNQDLSKNSCAKIINGYVSKKISELAQELEKFANICLKNKLEKVYEYFMSVSEMLRTVNFSNSYELNAKNIAQIKLPTAPRLGGDVMLKPQIDELRTRVKSQLENFQKNYICDDIDYLKHGLLETKAIVLALFYLVKEFNEIYDELKREINGLDFNDLEKKTLIILKNPKILEALREKYRYVFVDEYQDINSVQEEIISLIAGKNNRFMVGDIKQSIYRFRLCDPEIFLEKYEQYSAKNDLSELFKLNCNFRSDKKILRFVDLIFSGVMTEDFGGIDYEKDSKFVAGENNLDNPNSVNLYFIDTTKQKKESPVPSGVYSVKNHQQCEIDDEEKGVIEARLVSDTIVKIMEEVGFKNFKYSDVAVLVGSRNAMVNKFIETLKALNIKVSSDEKYNLVEKTYVQEILNFVKLACNFNNDFILFKVLKSRLFNFSDDELVKIRLIEPKARFYECVKNFNLLQDCELKLKLQSFYEQYCLFSNLAKILSIKQMCKKIVCDFSLMQINDASKEFENANQNIDLMIEALPETDTFDFVLNYGNFSLEVENECGGDAVSVMTIHKSKGIEFKYVFLINTTNEFNFESTYESVLFNKTYGVGVDYFDLVQRTQMPSIASSGIKLLEKRKLVEEQQRVLYVALTRAKERLFVICSKEQDKISPKISEHKKCFADWFEPIIFSELRGFSNKLINFKSFDAADLSFKSEIEQRTLLLKDKDVPKIEWFKYQYETDKNIRLKSSISKIIKENEGSNESFVGGGSSISRGVSYHQILQQIDFKKDDVNSQIDEICRKTPDCELDVDLIKNILKMQIFEEISSANYILTEREFYSKIPASMIEKAADGEYILQGIIDLIAIFDDYLIILDYKTGKLNESKLKNYALQLNTYAEVAERIYNKPARKKILCLIDEQKILEI